MRVLIFIFWFCLISKSTYAQTTSHNLLALKVVERISSAEMEGRRTGTKGNALARQYLMEEFNKLGYQVNLDTFYFGKTGKQTMGVNLLVEKEGMQNKNAAIVLTAHYDHLGIKDEKIYHGTDDNASGVGALFAIASFLQNHKTQHPVQLILLDAEEMGLKGAYHHVEKTKNINDKVLLNINLDMVSQSEKQELYACGTYHYPFLKPIADETADTFTNLTLKFGHDLPGGGSQDWTKSSDHFPFHLKGIPFIYFGVEDHAYYHQPEDTFDKLNHQFYVEVINFLTAFLVDVDKTLD